MSETDVEQYWMATDIESNGFVPEGGFILEVAAVMVDVKTLEEYGRFHRIVTHKEKIPLDTGAIGLHLDSGLFRDLVQVQPGDPSHVRGHLNLGEDLLDFIRETIISRYPKASLKRTVKLVGNTVNFDKDWLLHHCYGALGSMISHRTINCSSFRDTLMAWYGVSFERQGTHHRAMSDVEHSLHILRTYKNYMDRVPGIENVRGGC